MIFRELDVHPKHSRLFLDLDGVSCDFRKKAMETLGYDFHNTKFATKKERELEKAKLFENGVNFWDGMEPMEDFHILWDYVRKYDVHVLTAVPYGKDNDDGHFSNLSTQYAKEGKWNWVKRHLGIPEKNFHCCLRSEKKTYAVHCISGEYAEDGVYDIVANVLVDDNQSNVHEFKANRGHAILHTSALNTIEELKKLGF